MLQISFIYENPVEVKERLQKRNFLKAEELVQKIIALDEKRRKTQVELDDSRAESNNKAKEIGQLMKEGKKAEAEEIKAYTATLKNKIKDLEKDISELENELYEALVTIPNTPHVSVPAGKSSEDNVVRDEWGKFPELSGEALPHWELIQKYDIIDFDLGNKITGTGFPVYKDKGARLQRALVNFFLDEALKAGYTEIQPPIFVNRDSGFGTGQLPDKDGQMYYMPQDELYAIPTAEVPITNLYRDVILQEGEFPIKLVGFTPCFRREAGSWGADVRGLNRLHQFDKVEIVQIQHPDKSYEALEEMLQHSKNLLEKLGLPYRVLLLCGGDMGFTSAKTYDLEVYSAAQKRWLEVSSVSNFETFQSNRLKLRFKEKNQNKTRLVHTLNGSALALPRIVAALLENNQRADGIYLPEVLHPYTGFEKI